MAHRPRTPESRQEARLTMPSQRDQVLERLRAGDRSPFLDMLAELLDAHPDHAALKAFAAKTPDRYWQAITMAMKAAGYREQLDLRVEGLAAIVAEIQTLPDSELQKRLSDHAHAFLDQPATVIPLPLQPSPEEDVA